VDVIGDIGKPLRREVREPFPVSVPEHEEVPEQVPDLEPVLEPA
jgi:hypothetical protein